MNKLVLIGLITVMMVGCATKGPQEKVIIIIEEPILIEQPIPPVKEPVPQEVVEGPMLHDIEVINVETGEHDLKVKPGERVKLKAIPHYYSSQGDDIGERTLNFKPKWSAPHGVFSPNSGSEVLHIVPSNLGGVVTYWIEVKQKNLEGKIVSAKIRVDILNE